MEEELQRAIVWWESLDMKTKEELLVKVLREIKVVSDNETNTLRITKKGILMLYKINVL